MERKVTGTAQQQVPPQALLLSLLSLWVPVLTSSFFPDWTNADVGILIWLLALIPPFLLSYYRGWKGASLALAGGMAAFAIAQVLVTLLGAQIPGPEIMVGIIVIFIGVAMGSGVLSSLFRSSLSKAQEMALTDPGTGLPNRRHGMLHLTRAFAAAERGAALSVIMFDLDKFKRVNDRFGHQKGDEVLRVFAEILRRNTRTMNLSVRFGGEEFMSILDGETAEEAALMARRVLQELQSIEWPWGSTTVSAGISEFEEGMASPDVLVAAADQALYRAKSHGGDEVVVLARQGSSADAVVTSSADEYQDDGEGNGELVLVVDDDPAVLRTLSRGLLRRRYQPIEAGDPVKALQIVRGLDDPVDLVITDLVMPEMSGFRLVEMLMEIQPEVRALYISGYSSDEVRWSGVPGRVKAFLPKPISLDALTHAVRSILDAPAPAPEARDAETATELSVPSTAADAQGDPAVEEDANNGSLTDRLQASSARLEEAYGELLLRLAWTAEYRDDVTGQHAERVGRLCGMLARELGLSEEATGRIELAAPLHDLGKIAVPDSVLRKPDPLTPTEREIMIQHCVVGADLLAGSRHPLVQEAQTIARSHHERWDGDGYPDGLAGTEIPLAARITAVADAFDSLTDTRPYRPAVSRDEAVQLIMDDRGRHFDPDVVDALLRLDEAGTLDSVQKGILVGEWKGGVGNASIGTRVGQS
ncbi:MAG: diguanylate cyclase [Longimicrobiales bacterium]